MEAYFQQIKINVKLFSEHTNFLYQLVSHERSIESGYTKTFEFHNKAWVALVLDADYNKKSPQECILSSLKDLNTNKTTVLEQTLIYHPWKI